MEKIISDKNLPDIKRNDEPEDLFDMNNGNFEEYQNEQDSQ
jgi:hypothetical protein